MAGGGGRKGTGQEEILTAAQFQEGFCLANWKFGVKGFAVGGNLGFPRKVCSIGWERPRECSLCVNKVVAPEATLGC